MRATLAPLLLALSACDTPGACTLEARFGMRAFLRDSVTGAAYTDSAVVIAREGTFADTLKTFGISDSVWMGLAERAGTYRLDVAAQGYHAWSRNDLRVTAGECHVQPIDVTVRLVPL